jgi:hypothetical protein
MYSYLELAVEQDAQLHPASWVRTIPAGRQLGCVATDAEACGPPDRERTDLGLRFALSRHRALDRQLAVMMNPDDDRLVSMGAALT